MMKWVKRLVRRGLGVALLLTLFSVDSLPAQERCRTSSITPRYSVETTYPDQQRISHILTTLEKVPDPIQEKANKEGYTVAIVNRTIDVETAYLGFPEFPLGSNEMEFTDDRGRRIVATYTSLDGQKEIKWIVYGENTSENRFSSPVPVGGRYVHNSKTALVPQTFKDENDKRANSESSMIYIPPKESRIETIALHEYGHLQDDATGSPSQSNEFTKIYEKSKERHEKLEGLVRKISTARESLFYTLLIKGELSKLPVNIVNSTTGLVQSYQHLLEPQDRFTKSELRQLETYFEINLENYLGSRHEMQTPLEFWAGLSAAYYDTPASRTALKIVYPEAYSFIRQWEQKYAPGC